jgi:hypothetical protein
MPNTLIGRHRSPASITSRETDRHANRGTPLLPAQQTSTRRHGPAMADVGRALPPDAHIADIAVARTRIRDRPAASCSCLIKVGQLNTAPTDE